MTTEELRCHSCIALGVECPDGYFDGNVTCDVCGYQFVLVAAMCAPIINCPECEGTVTYDE